MAQYSLLEAWGSHGACMGLASGLHCLSNLFSGYSLSNAELCQCGCIKTFDDWTQS